jgi:diketogulonate reductase-like aldo/keto reductase
LTRQAIDAGFRAIDTANQRRHYFEAAVGDAVAEAIAQGIVTREELFLQTKFTHRRGQDHRLPYDAAARPAVQVEQSFASSLAHLQVDYVDAYLLHGPSVRSGLAPGDRETWGAMELLAKAGKARALGISNVTLAQLEELWATASVKPSFVQNRCYASQGWDRAVRAFCASHDIGYQAFSVLTANREVLDHPLVRGLAAKQGVTTAQIVFRFALQAGMIVLTGTSSRAHMAEDLAVNAFELAAGDVQKLEALDRLA